MFDRRRPGRPTDPPGKYAEYMERMATFICHRYGSREGRSIKAAARHVGASYPQALSTRHLERLYARNARTFEIEYMRRWHGERWADQVARVESAIASDERILTLAQDLVPGIPPYRWYPAELEELLSRVALLKKN